MKNKITAGILGILLGGLGIHKFYLDRPGQGILYLLFCWTFIPAVVGFVEGIIYLTMTDQDFNAKYNSGISAGTATAPTTLPPKS
jgi:TM2 domain-containing membrane protein YozV